MARRFALVLLGCASNATACTCGRDGAPSDAVTTRPDVAPPASSGSDAVIVVDGVEHRAAAAVRMRRGEWTEDIVVSSTPGGCEIASNRVGGVVDEHGVRIAWTMAPDFAHGGVRPIDAWGLVRGERGALESGPLEAAPVELRSDTIAAPVDSFRFELDNGALFDHRFAGRGTLSPLACPAEPAPTGATLESLHVEVGRLHVGIRSVLMRELRSGAEVARSFELASEVRHCGDHGERELAVLISAPAARDEAPVVQVVGRAVPTHPPIVGPMPLTLQLPPDAATPVVRFELPVGFDGRGRLGDVDFAITGRVSARVCAGSDAGP